MTDEQINQRIAEACGWTDIHDSGPWHNNTLWGYPPIKPGQGGNAYKYLPNYCTNLNAMHEAEKVLQNQFAAMIEEAYWRNLQWVKPHPIYATARQRAEAFLRTLGKWEEVQG
jgi:hypothetical protein